MTGELPPKRDGRLATPVEASPDALVVVSVSLEESDCGNTYFEGTDSEAKDPEAMDFEPKR